MDFLYAVNAQSADARWGDPATGALPNSLALNFECHRAAMFADQRHLYVTGTKVVGGVVHAWLAVVDTCANNVVQELDLGVGHGGQCAMHPAVGSSRAYVAVSRAAGTTDTGPLGPNRIEVLNVANPASPTLLAPPFLIPGVSPYGTLHIVWSTQLNLLFTSHRGDGLVYQIAPMGGMPVLLATVMQQPTGLALSQNGLILYVARRTAGDILALDLSTRVIPPPSVLPIALPNGTSLSAINLAVDRLDRILATSFRPGDGVLFVVQGSNPALPLVVEVDTQGSSLGSPAVSPDGSRAFISRGDQGDIAEVDLGAYALQPAFIPAGQQPSDIVVVSHLAGQQLVADPPAITAACDGPRQVTIRAHDACGQELIGVSVRPTSISAAVFVSNQTRPTPATFDVECTDYGTGTVTFTTVTFPLSQVTVDVTCNCLIEACVDFSQLSGGPLPQNVATLAGVISVSTLNMGVFQGPQVFAGLLHLSGGTLRFVLPPGVTIDDLVVRYTRYDNLSQVETVTVTHAGGATPVPASAGVSRGDHEIACPFQGIREWTVSGGAETRLREMCFRAPPGVFP